MKREFFALFLLTSAPAWAADAPPSAPVLASSATGIQLPADNDDYAKMVARAAAQDNTLDFRALRFAYLSSAQRARVNDHDASISALRKDMIAGVQANDAARVRAAALQLLSKEYVDMQAQKLLRQSCTVLKDTACADQAHFVEFGLLRSITTKGNGKSCDTGWEVVTTGEEYTMLSFLDVTMVNQSLARGSKHECDVMVVKDDKGVEQTYFFNADTVLADEAKMMLGGK